MKIALVNVIKKYTNFSIIIIFFKILLIFREGKGREKERERNVNVWLLLTHTPHWGPGLQPRHVP